MYKVPLPELKEKIVASGKLSLEEVEEKIKAKINELSGLISEEGAAHIIANELGVELVNKNSDKLKIKEIYSGMRDITTVGKVVRKFDVREFAKGESTGKVCSLVLGDETGTVRVVFWNEQVDEVSSLKEGDILKIESAYVRDNRGQKEIHLGKIGHIDINPDGEVITGVREGNTYERVAIDKLEDGAQGAEILATVVQVFDPRFFTLCPQCNKRANNNECATHGTVEPVLSYVLNAVLDDGTGNIRAVFWKNQTNHLVEKEDLSEFQENLAAFEEIKNDLLGEQFKVMGRVKKNDMFDRLEFNVQMVEKAKPEEEIAKLEKVEEKLAVEASESKVGEVSTEEVVSTTKVNVEEVADETIIE
jgi:replication factor A1